MIENTPGLSDVISTHFYPNQETVTTRYQHAMSFINKNYSVRNPCLGRVP